MTTAGAGLFGFRFREPGSRDESIPAATNSSTNGSPVPKPPAEAGISTLDTNEAGPSNGPRQFYLQRMPDGISSCFDPAHWLPQATE